METRKIEVTISRDNMMSQIEVLLRAWGVIKDSEVATIYFDLNKMDKVGHFNVNDQIPLIIHLDQLKEVRTIYN